MSWGFKDHRMEWPPRVGEQFAGTGLEFVRSGSEKQKTLSSCGLGGKVFSLLHLLSKANRKSL